MRYISTVLVLAVSASTLASPYGAYVLKVTDQEKCVGAKGKDSTELTIGDCTGDSAQLWEWRSNNYQWRNQLTEKCLTLTRPGEGASTPAKLDDCKSSNDGQIFRPPPSGPFVSVEIEACPAPCTEGGSDLCAFDDIKNDWCNTVGKEIYNRKMEAKIYCDMDKAKGEWKRENETACTKDCGGGTKKITYVCGAVSGGYQNACCIDDDMPSTTKVCNLIACDAKLEDFYVLKSADGNKCIDGSGNEATLSDCSKEAKDEQLWIQARNLWVNKKTNNCLAVPQYFSCDKPNVVSVAECEPTDAMQKMPKPVPNAQDVNVCVGPCTDGSKACGFRSNDDGVQSWCKTPEYSDSNTNKKMGAVKFCSTDGAVCGSAPAPSSSSSLPSSSSSSESTSTTSESTSTSISTSIETTPATTEEPTTTAEPIPPPATEPAVPEQPTPEAAATTAVSIPPPSIVETPSSEPAPTSEAPTNPPSEQATIPPPTVADTATPTDNPFPPPSETSSSAPVVAPTSNAAQRPSSPSASPSPSSSSAAANTGAPSSTEAVPETEKDFGPWSKCSVTCDKGIQDRQCTVAGSQFCQGATIRLCDAGPCQRSAVVADGKANTHHQVKKEKKEEKEEGKKEKKEHKKGRRSVWMWLFGAE